MFIFLKMPNLTKEQLNHLYHLHPWWEKTLNKLIKKQKKWLIHFSQNPDLYFPIPNYQIKHYDIMFKNINHFLEFYNSKMKVILKQEKILKRFSNWANQVAQLLAINHFLVNTIFYFDTLDNQNIENRSQWIIDYNNKFLMNIYGRYKRDLAKLTNNEQQEVLKQIYANEHFIEVQLIDPIIVFNFVSKYVANLAKTKKMTVKNSVEILYQTIFLAIFFNTFLELQKQLLKNII